MIQAKRSVKQFLQTFSYFLNYCKKIFTLIAGEKQKSLDFDVFCLKQEVSFIGMIIAI